MDGHPHATDTREALFCVQEDALRVRVSIDSKATMRRIVRTVVVSLVLCIVFGAVVYGLAVSRGRGSTLMTVAIVSTVVLTGAVMCLVGMTSVRQSLQLEKKGPLLIIAMPSRRVAAGPIGACDTSAVVEGLWLRRVTQRGRMRAMGWQVDLLMRVSKNGCATEKRVPWLWTGVAFFPTENLRAVANVLGVPLRMGNVAIDQDIGGVAPR